MSNRYTNFVAQTWKPNRTYKGKDWILVDLEFTSWVHCRKSKSEMVIVQEYRTEKKITIPIEQHPLLHDTGSEDKHVN